MCLFNRDRSFSDNDPIIDYISNRFLYRNSKIIFILNYDNDNISINYFFKILKKINYKHVIILNNKDLSNINIINTFRFIESQVNNFYISEVWINIFNNDSNLLVSDYPILKSIIQSFFYNIKEDIRILCFFDMLDYNIHFNLKYKLKYNKIHDNYYIENSKKYNPNIIILYGSNTISRKIFILLKKYNTYLFNLPFLYLYDKIVIIFNNKNYLHKSLL